MHISLKKTMLVSVGVAVVGIALARQLVYRDLYKTFPNVDRQILRTAYRNAVVNAFTGQYEAGMSTSEIRELVLNEVEKVS